MKLRPSMNHIESSVFMILVINIIIVKQSVAVAVWWTLLVCFVRVVLHLVYWSFAKKERNPVMSRSQTGFLIFWHHRVTLRKVTCRQTTMPFFSFLFLNLQIQDSTRQIFWSDSTIATVCWNVFHTSASQIQLNLFTVTPQRRNTRIPQFCFSTHHSSSHPSCYMHKTISDGTVFFSYIQSIRVA